MRIRNMMRINNKTRAPAINASLLLFTIERFQNIIIISEHSTGLTFEGR